MVYAYLIYLLIVIPAPISLRKLFCDLFINEVIIKNKWEKYVFHIIWKDYLNIMMDDKNNF